MQSIKESLCLPDDECDYKYDHRSDCYPNTNNSNLPYALEENDNHVFAYNLLDKSAETNIVLLKEIEDQSSYSFKINRKRFLNPTGSLEKVGLVFSCVCFKKY